MGFLNLLKMGSNSSENQSFGKVDRLSSPFGEVGHSISDSELKETAFEILDWCCWDGRSQSTSTQQSNQSSVCRHGGGESTSTPQYEAHKKLTKQLALVTGEPKKKTLVEVMGNRMGVSKMAYKRIDRALKMIQGKQEGGNIESIILPLELLEEFTVKDFGNQKVEYKASQIRHLKILEAGLLPNPQSPLENNYSILCGARKTPIENRANSKWMLDVRKAVTFLASSSSDGSDSSICHWADRFPLNLRLYEMLLDACFEITDKTCMVKEVNEVIELIKLTWGILGVNQMLHNLCFSSVLFRRSVATDQVNSVLLLKATQLVEVAKDEKAIRDPEYSKILNQTFKFMLSEAEKRFLHYLKTFQPSNITSMKGVVGFGLSAAEIFINNISDESRQEKKAEVDVARNRVSTDERMESANWNMISSKNQSNPSPAPSILHNDIGDEAKKENKGFSPLLKRWKTFAAVVDVATLHPYNRNELKQIFSGLTQLTSDDARVWEVSELVGMAYDFLI